MALIGSSFGRGFAALVFTALLPVGASAQTQERVNVYQYAIDHPVADVAMPVGPSLGASVPAAVQLATVDDDRIYGYFYYQGRPVIVDMSTRSVVRIDE